MQTEPKSIQELYRKKKAWNKGSWATDGKKCGTEFDREHIKDNEDAVCFCLGGAITKIYDDEEQAHVESRLAGVIRALFSKRIWLHRQPSMGDESVIVRFNDDENTTIKEIRQVVKIACV